jgi:hypothetical protein
VGPTIAVVVPNRNDARHLSTCLRSVLEQPVQADELIVVDDHSTDDSVPLIRSILSGVPNAQLVQTSANLGTYRALDEGLKHCRSEYALFLAANDFVLPGIFERAKATLVRFPGAALWSALVWLVDDSGAPIRLHNSPVIALRDAFFTAEQCQRLAYRVGSWFGATTVIYQRRMLEDVGCFDPAYGGLADFVAAMTVAGRHGAAYSPEPLAAVRIHAAGNLSRTLNDPAGLEAILERVAQRGPLLAPQLFTPKFLERMALRLRFAAVRVSPPETVAELAARVGGWRGAALRAIHRALPARIRLLRVALAFVVLRPFDLVPTLWYRVLGWALVRLRTPYPPRFGHDRVVQSVTHSGDAPRNRRT